jgi:hypothetical protein
MSKNPYKIKPKYKSVGKTKVFTVEKNDLFVLDALMHDGSQQKYQHHHTNLKYSEHGGLLDFDARGLERIIVTTPKESDRKDPEIYFPVVTEDAEDYEFMYHTHPPTPTPGARSKLGIVYEIPSLSDINTFIITYIEGKTQGSIIIAPEGIYVIRALKKKLKPENYQLNELMQEIMYMNYKFAEKYKFNVTIDIFYKKIITNTKLSIKLKELIQKYTNKEITIDFFKRKKDQMANWVVNKLYLIVNPKEIQIKK